MKERITPVRLSPEEWQRAHDRMAAMRTQQEPTIQDPILKKNKQNKNKRNKSMRKRSAALAAE